MGLQVIAEGIEDGEQAQWLREHGCSMAQGYAFGRPAPLPARELEELPDLDDDGPAAGLDAGAQLVPATELHDPSEDEWGPEADTGPSLRSAAVPQLDSFGLPAAGPPLAQPVDPADATTGELPAAGSEPDTGAVVPEAAAPEAAEPGAVEPGAVEPEAGFDPGVFRPSRAFLELRELLMANGAADIAGIPEPREPAAFGDLRSLTDDPTDFSGLRPWLESFQQRLGPRTGEHPGVSEKA